MQPTVPQVDHYRLARCARKSFCLPTVGVSRLLLFVHLLVFGMFAVMSGSLIGLKYPGSQCALEISFFELLPLRRTTEVRGTGESRRHSYLQRDAGRCECISPRTNSLKLPTVVRVDPLERCSHFPFLKTCLNVILPSTLRST
jgi:hypothetical protein